MWLSMWANHTWTAFIKTPEQALNLLFYLLLIILICYDESSCAWYRANLPLFMAKLYQIFSPFFAPISRSNNTVEPNVSWDERSTSEKRPASGGEEKDCQRFSSQFTGELTMGLYYARCKCGLLQLPACLPLVIDRKVNRDHKLSITNVFCFLFSNRWQMPTRI